MSRYDGLIIPRSYSEYLNKTDSATLSQMLQHLTGLWSHAVSEGDNKPVTSDAVYEALTDAATIQQALQLPGVLSGAVSAGDNKPVTSNAVNEALTDAATIQQALQLPGVLSGAVAAGDNKAVTSNAVNKAITDIRANKVYNYANSTSSTIYIYLFTGSDLRYSNPIDYIKVLEKRFNFAPSLIEFSYATFEQDPFRYNFNEILPRNKTYGNKIIITNNYKVYLKVVSYSYGRIETNRVLQMEEYTALPTGETEQYIL